VALVFIRPGSEFSMTVRKKVVLEGGDRSLRRSELPSWTYLDPDWPTMPDNPRVKKDGRSLGLHEDVLAMLTDRPATSLAELGGLPFRRVVLGAPSMRWTVHTPQLRCPQVRAVQALLRSAPQFAARRGRPGPARPAHRPLLRFLQREEEEGRFVVNLDILVDMLRREYGREMFVDVLPTGVLRNASWTAQFRLLSSVDMISGAHGAALTWMWVLPHGGALVELLSWESANWMPCSRSWDDPAASGATFAGLARLAGLHHVCVRAASAAPQGMTPVAKQYLGGGDWMRANLFIDPRIAKEVFREALDRVKGPNPPCEGSAWGI